VHYLLLERRLPEGDSLETGVHEEGHAGSRGHSLVHQRVRFDEVQGHVLEGSAVVGALPRARRNPSDRSQRATDQRAKFGLAPHSAKYKVVAKIKCLACIGKIATIFISAHISLSLVFFLKLP